MNITEKLSNLLFLQGKLEHNLEMQISFLLHDKSKIEKIMTEKQETLEEKISTLKEEIDLLQNKVIKKGFA